MFNVFVFQSDLDLLLSLISNMWFIWFIYMSQMTSYQARELMELHKKSRSRHILMFKSFFIIRNWVSNKLFTIVASRKTSKEWENRLFGLRVKRYMWLYFDAALAVWCKLQRGMKNDGGMINQEWETTTRPKRHPFCPFCKKNAMGRVRQCVWDTVLIVTWLLRSIIHLLPRPRVLFIITEEKLSHLQLWGGPPSIPGWGEEGGGVLHEYRGSHSNAHRKADGTRSGVWCVIIRAEPLTSAWWSGWCSGAAPCGTWPAPLAPRLPPEVQVWAGTPLLHTPGRTGARLRALTRTSSCQLSLRAAEGDI